MCRNTAPPRRMVHIAPGYFPISRNNPIEERNEFAFATGVTEEPWIHIRAPKCTVKLVSNYRFDYA